MSQENPTCCTPQNSVKKNISQSVDYKNIKSNNQSKKKFEGKKTFEKEKWYQL